MAATYQALRSYSADVLTASNAPGEYQPLRSIGRAYLAIPAFSEEPIYVAASFALDRPAAGVVGHHRAIANLARGVVDESVRGHGGARGTITITAASAAATAAGEAGRHQPEHRNAQVRHPGPQGHRPVHEEHRSRCRRLNA